MAEVRYGDRERGHPHGPREHLRAARRSRNSRKISTSCSLRRISAADREEHVRIDNPRKGAIFKSMKRMQRVRNIFFVFFLVAGCLWFMQAVLSSPPASAMNSMGSSSGVQANSGVQAKKMNPATCPMKGALPCCQHPAPPAFCATSLCDLCLFSGSLQPARSAQEIRAPSSAPAAHPLPIPLVEPPPPYKLSSFEDSARPISFFPPVNRPLLI